MGALISIKIDRKQIEAAYKASNGIHSQKGTNQSHAVPDNPRDASTENGSGETPEITFVWLKLGEALLVFVTVWLVFVTKDLVGSTQGLVQGSDETAKRQLRAYMSFIGPAFQISKVGAAEQIIISVEARMKNAGQTPARNCKISIGWIEADTTPTISFQDKLVSPMASVGPGIKIVSRRDHKPIAVVTEASFARKRLYLFVRCDYEDVWGNPRHIAVCLRTHPEFKPQNITPQNFETFKMNWSCPTWGNYSEDS